jgi:hypothetical protein
MLDLCIPILERLGAEPFATTAHKLQEEMIRNAWIFNPRGEKNEAI